MYIVLGVESQELIFIRGAEGPRAEGPRGGPIGGPIGGPRGRGAEGRADRGAEGRGAEGRVSILDTI